MKMDKYVLVTKQDEIINKCEAGGLEDAVKYFATIKNLSPQTLLNIYSVYAHGTRKSEEEPQ